MRPQGCISGGTEIGLMTRLEGTVANSTGHKVGVLSYGDARFTHHYVFKPTAHCRGPLYDKPCQPTASKGEANRGSRRSLELLLRLETDSTLIIV